MVIGCLESTAGHEANDATPVFIFVRILLPCCSKGDYPIRQGPFKRDWDNLLGQWCARAQLAVILDRWHSGKCLTIKREIIVSISSLTTPKDAQDKGNGVRGLNVTI